MQEIFVFGSNLAGRHGLGAARYARLKHGAVYGQGTGLQGNSYGLPTKDHKLKVLPLVKIRYYVKQLITFAEASPEMHFNITRVGCGLAGYDWERDVCPLFPQQLPNNCVFI